MIEYLILILGLSYFIYLVYEYHNNLVNRRKVKYVIHVNGIRGKSTVSRLIDAGLRSSGLKVYTKTTGSAPKVIGVNGVEEEIQRKGPPNIKEQISIVKYAAQQEAQVLIIECMAIMPYNQYITENKILKSDIGVVTNVRHDHLEEMGPSLQDVAYSLGCVTPKDGVLVLGENRFKDVFEGIAVKNRSRCISAQNYGFTNDFDFEENINLALEVCKILGVDSEQAYDAMRNYKRDPGALSTHNIITSNGSRVKAINALACNDPDSTNIIYNKFISVADLRGRSLIIIYNNRHDRGLRMSQHIKLILSLEADEIWVTGENTSLMVKNLQGCDNVNKVIDMHIVDEKHIKDINRDSVIFAIGNIGGGGNQIIDLMTRLEE